MADYLMLDHVFEQMPTIVRLVSNATTGSSEKPIALDASGSYRQVFEIYLGI